ncbi:MAG: RagB/SusD family nutrient uptake outer membrane protein [Chitinophagaceae bacterium]
MKKLKSQKFSLFTFIIMLTVMVGCNKDWLKPKPLSLFTPETALLDSRGILGLLSFCEKTERAEFYTGDVSPLHTEMLFSEVSIQGQTLRLGPAQNLNLQITPTSQLNDAKFNMIGWFWTQFYRVIKTADMIIARIDEAKFKDETERNQVLASAYFHRAYCYYRLTLQFGDIPFIGREIKSPRLDFYSTNREVILTKIKKDMEYAVLWCSDNVDRGRATKGACSHLLTEINLALGKFDDAIASANAVINGGVYRLMTVPFGVVPAEEGNYLRNLGIIRSDVIARLHWPPNKSLAENKEVLYLSISRDELNASKLNTDIMRSAVPFWGSTSSYQIYTPDGKSPSMSTTRNEEFQLLETFGRGVGNTRPTWYSQKTIWDDPNDLRHKRGNWMRMEDLVYNNSKSLKGKSVSYGKNLQFRDANGKVLGGDTIMNWFEWPHYKAYQNSPLQSVPTGGANDMYIYRLAETYLLRAEAYWWKGDLANTMADVNAVRTRAGCAPYTDISKIDIGTVLDERARELFYEEPRKSVLTRISYLFAKTGKSYNGKTYTLAKFGTENFFYDRIMLYNDFYNKGVINISGVEYKISPYHILWPIPQQAISANVQGTINQNFGYDGYGRNKPPLTAIAPEDDN